MLKEFIFRIDVVVSACWLLLFPVNASFSLSVYRLYNVDYAFILICVEVNVCYSIDMRTEVYSWSPCVCVCVPDDVVYLPDESLLQEYVMNEDGVIYVGSWDYISSRPWNYGQVIHTHTRSHSHTHTHCVSGLCLRLCLSGQ